MTTSRWKSAAVVVAAAALVPFGPASVAHADSPPATPYPVPQHFLVDAVSSALQGGGASAPGTNDWSCTPSAAHPEPVILVHGLMANRVVNWQTYGPLLANAGYCVFALTYGSPDGNPNALIGGLAPMEQSAKELDAFVDRVREATGAQKVALVGHSEGATMPYWYIKNGGGASKVSKMIGLSPGVKGFGPPVPIGSNAPAPLQFLPNSDFMRSLNDGGVTVPGVAYTQIVTRYDEIIVPFTAGIVDEPGAKNYVVQDYCPADYADHLSINSDPAAAGFVLGALDPSNAPPIDCALVLPAIGVVPEAR